MRVMRGFVKWAQKRGSLNATVAVPMPVAHQRVLEVLSKREVSDMESAATSERDKLIIRLLADLGLRLGELLALRPEDLVRDRGNRLIKVRGKGHKERLVPIHPQLFSRLERYANRKQRADALSGLIFVTDRRRDGHYTQLAQRTVQQTLKYIAESAGITKRVHPHLFRHSNITWQLNDGVPVKHIQENVGHADLSMITSVYSHVTANDRYESMLAAIRKDEDARR
jgi:integrase/recombinase XerD